MDTPEGLGHRLKQARLDRAAARGREFSQTEVGRALGVTGVTIGRWEAGGAEPALAQIVRLAGLLGVEPGWLAFGDPPTTSAPTGEGRGALFEREATDAAATKKKPRASGAQRRA